MLHGAFRRSVRFSCDRLPSIVLRTPCSVFVLQLRTRWTVRSPSTYTIAWISSKLPRRSVSQTTDDCYEKYFNSLGCERVERYVNKHCRESSINSRRLQSVVSRFCGHYCSCFCIVRSRGVHLYRILRYFTYDTGLNDVVVMCKIVNDWKRLMVLCFVFIEPQTFHIVIDITFVQGRINSKRGPCSKNVGAPNIWI